MAGEEETIGAEVAAPAAPLVEETPDGTQDAEAAVGELMQAPASEAEEIKPEAPEAAGAAPVEAQRAKRAGMDLATWQTLPEATRTILSNAQDSMAQEFGALGRKLAGGSDKPAAKPSESPAAGSLDEPFKFVREYEDPDSPGAQTQWDAATQQHIIEPLERFLEGVRQEVAAIRGERRQTQLQQTRATVEKFFENSAKDFDFLGTGPTDVLSLEPHQKERKVVLDEANLIRAGAKAVGRKMSVEEALQRALDLHPQAKERIKSRAVEEAKAAGKSRRGTFTPKPGAKKVQGQDDDPDGTKAAIAAVAEAMTS